MAGPVADVAERGVKSFMNTMKEVGTDKAVSEALMGGAAGVGINMAYNVASGDSGGYMGAGLLGGAAGGLGRTGLKHFNLETQASNLMSTFKAGAVGGMTKAQKAVQAGSNNSPKGQILRHGKDELSTPQYQASIDADRREAASYMKSGDVVKSEEITARANAKNIRRKELEARRHKSLGTNAKTPKTPKTKNWVSPEDKERYITAPEAVQRTKDRLKNKNFTDSLTSNKDSARAAIERSKTMESYNRVKGQLNSPPKPFKTPDSIQGSSVLAAGQHNSLDQIQKSSANSFDYKQSASQGTKQAITKTLNNGSTKKQLKAQGKADLKRYGDAETSLANIQQNLLANSLHKFG